MSAMPERMTSLYSSSSGMRQNFSPAFSSASLKRWYVSLRGAIDGHHAESLEACEGILASNTHDPEVLFHMARTVARCGHPARALELLSSSVDEGYFNVPLFARDPWLDPLRGDRPFADIVARADARYRRARDAFEQAGGHRLLALAKQVS